MLDPVYIDLLIFNSHIFKIKYWSLQAKVGHYCRYHLEEIVKIECKLSEFIWGEPYISYVHEWLESVRVVTVLPWSWSCSWGCRLVCIFEGQCVICGGSKVFTALIVPQLHIVYARHVRVSTMGKAQVHTHTHTHTHTLGLPRYIVCRYVMT